VVHFGINDTAAAFISPVTINEQPSTILIDDTEEATAPSAAKAATMASSLAVKAGLPSRHLHRSTSAPRSSLLLS